MSAAGNAPAKAGEAHDGGERGNEVEEGESPEQPLPVTWELFLEELMQMTTAASTANAAVMLKPWAVPAPEEISVDVHDKGEVGASEGGGLIGGDCAKGAGAASAPSPAEAWKGPDVALLSAVADVCGEAEVSYYGDSYVLLLLKPKHEDSPSQPTPSASVRLHNMQEALRDVLVDGFAPRGLQMWPLHTRMGRRAVAECSPLVMRPCSWRGVGRAIFCVGISTSSPSLFGQIAEHYGPSAAYSSAYSFLYVRMLWLLAAVTVISMVIGEDSVGTHFQRIVWEVLKVLVLVWGAATIGFSWTAEQLMGPVATANAAELQPKGPAPATPRSCPSCSCPFFLKCLQIAVAWVLTTFSMLVVSLVIVLYAQFEMFLIYSWGDCVNLGCTSSEDKHGFVGWLVDVLSSILQALIWLLLLEANKALAKAVAGLRDHASVEDYQRCVIAYTFYMEGVGKLLPYVFIGMWFVPNKENRPAFDFDPECMDSGWYNPFDPAYLLCIGNALPGEHRRHHFMKMMTGPFMVAPFVAILMKVIVPIVAIFLGWFARSCQCRPRCCDRLGDAIARLLTLIFAFDDDTVGMFPWIFRGHTYSTPRLRRSLPRARRDEGEGCLRDERASLSHALAQAKRKRFDPYDEILEVNLNFAFVLFFAPVRPEGILTTLAARWLDAHADLTKMMFIRRKDFPKHIEIIHGAHIWFTCAALLLGIGWSVVLSYITYNYDFYWTLHM